MQVAATMERFGRVDILMNSTGTFYLDEGFNPGGPGSGGIIAPDNNY